MKTHQLSKHKLYKKYRDILKRCENKATKNYYLYGGRGITMCDEWKNDFVKFFNWSIENGWKEGLFIDRIDNDGNYEPSNCRYVTRKESLRNKRTSIRVNYKGEEVMLCHLLERLGLSHKRSTIKNRIVNLNWPIEVALYGKSHAIHRKMEGINKNSKVVEYDGELYSLIGLCRKLGIEDKYDNVRLRLKRGWELEKAIDYGHS